MSIVVSDFLRLALMENRVARAGDVPAPDDMGDALLVFNELLDSLNVTDRALYSSMFTTFTLTPNLQPHTIGLAVNSPTLTTSVGRPARIMRANLVLSHNIRVPFQIATDEEWNDIRAGAAAGQAVTITASVPRILWYSPDWPNGSIYLWPVESTAYGLELQTETLLAQVALTDTIDLPFAYQLALRLTTAESLANMFGQAISPDLARRAMQARAAAWGGNDTIPSLVTRDAGMPSASGGRSNWNYLTGAVD